MAQITPTESQLAVYLKSMDSQFVSEKAVLVEIYQDLSSRKTVVGNKDIIFSLLEKLETENDVIKLDIYRQALEMVVHLTPDDTIN
ncbi:biofilm development regulator YmgB/AriR family protein [Pantoea sp.]|uniref:biofilm development regulator YmgB/AriR family protein n=1 Tax=Pantoea sp. TaxID=69393 RepID=UPI0028B23DB8|nr:biofilm development regulator YmgB/AriR family protein [Pantoea sp.]